MLLLCTSNSEYKDLLINTPIILKVLQIVKDIKEYEIDRLKQELKGTIPTQTDEAFVQMLTVLCIFLKENQLGQSVYTEYVQETKCPIDKSGPLIKTDFDPISNKNEQL